MIATRILSVMVGFTLLAIVTVGCGTLTGAAIGAGSGAALARGRGTPRKGSSLVPVWAPQREQSTTLPAGDDAGQGPVHDTLGGYRDWGQTRHICTATLCACAEKRCPPWK